MLYLQCPPKRTFATSFTVTSYFFSLKCSLLSILAALSLKSCTAFQLVFVFPILSSKLALRARLKWRQRGSLSCYFQRSVFSPRVLISFYPLFFLLKIKENVPFL